MIRTVIIKLQIEGFHNWLDAPDEVSFLRHRHRHIFNITCGYKVYGLDRELEIFMKREDVRKLIGQNYMSRNNEYDFGQSSCEMIAELILTKSNGMIWCEVWEETTGGGRVSYE